MSWLILSGAWALFERGFTRGSPHRPDTDRLPACGHIPMLKQPQAFSAFVRDWLGRRACRRERRGRPLEVAA